jgi:hypothetical protein
MASALVRCFGLVALAGAAVAVSAAASCRIYEPPNKPVDSCRISCREKAKAECSEEECERGCEFILDRLAEREGETVIKCVASRRRRCADVIWADCAAKIGPHIDGGPPGYVPQPPEEEP